MKRKVGRPANPDRAAKQKARRIFPVEITPEFKALMATGHANYVKAHGRDTTDVEIIRDALRHYQPKAT